MRYAGVVCWISGSHKKKRRFWGNLDQENTQMASHQRCLRHNESVSHAPPVVMDERRYPGMAQRVSSVWVRMSP